MSGKIIIQNLQVEDLRFPTSLLLDGSDAMHANPDYSCVYVVINTNQNDLKGYGLTFTLGRGNEIVLKAVKALEPLIVKEDVNEIFSNFSKYWRKLTSDSQLRWVTYVQLIIDNAALIVKCNELGIKSKIGPEKGVIHLATAAIINALWDLWARMEKKPLWKLLTDMEPEKLISTIDFRYIKDVLTEQEAIEILKKNQLYKAKRESEMLKFGYPAYTTQIGWIGYSEDKIKELCKKYMNDGFTAFKIKVGLDINQDKERCRLVRSIIGDKNHLMVDANQKWEVDEAIEWMKELSLYKPLWIEEPTSPDDVVGHSKIAESLKSSGIGVATGEMCANRVMFKQLLQMNAIKYCQIDSCRVGGVNELLSIYLMANKFSVSVCPHAGGIGLCEMVQHLQIWDYIAITGTTKDRYIEYVDQQHEHFTDPVTVKNAHYQIPQKSGYSCQMYESTIENYKFPTGKVWSDLFRTK